MTRLITLLALPSALALCVGAQQIIEHLKLQAFILNSVCGTSLPNSLERVHCQGCYIAVLGAIGLTCSISQSILSSRPKLTTQNWSNGLRSA